MLKFKIKVKKIDINDKKLSIISQNNDKIFISPIIKGSIKCKIFNESEEEVNLGNLEENSIIKIYGVNEKNQENKNIVIIKKIQIKNTYIFNSDSSEDIDY